MIYKFIEKEITSNATAMFAQLIGLTIIKTPPVSRSSL
jgi:hypothetical protein